MSTQAVLPAPHSSRAGSAVMPPGHRSCCLASSEVVACAPVEQLIPVSVRRASSRPQPIATHCPLPAARPTTGAPRGLSHAASNAAAAALPSSVDRRCLICSERVTSARRVGRADVRRSVRLELFVCESSDGLEQGVPRAAPVRSATTIDRLIRSSRRSSASTSSATTSPHTPTTSCRSKSPANTASSTNRRLAGGSSRSNDHFTVACSVRWRPARGSLRKSKAFVDVIEHLYD